MDTKIGAPPPSGMSSLNDVIGLSAAAIRAQIGVRLHRLRTDRIYIQPPLLAWKDGAMSTNWQTRVDEFWSNADDERPAEMLAAMKALVQERTPGDADAQFEWASVHDFLGREHEAIPFYRAALATGLAEPNRTYAIIQLASSLRNVGEFAEAIELLRTDDLDSSVGDAPHAFLALALLDAGRASESVRVALQALAPHLPEYRRAIEFYAGELGNAPTPPPQR